MLRSQPEHVCLQQEKYFFCRQTGAAPDLNGMRNVIFFLVVAACMAQDQRFSFGLKAGSPVRSALPYAEGPESIVDTGRWTVGPTAEVRLFGDLSFEVDALYRGYRYQSSNGGSYIFVGESGTSPVLTVFSSYKQDAKEWDVPLLLKYRFHAGKMRPFVDVGGVLARVSSDFTSRVSCFSGQDLSTSQAVCSSYGFSDVALPSTFHSSVNRHGPTAGLGVEFRYGHIKIAPEVRYMRLTQPNVNEVTVMAGFAW
jgi:hypothetical protein